MNLLANHIILKFQSTHPGEVQRKHCPLDTFQPYISIHAPWWGATIKLGTRGPRAKPFQSTHPGGVRQTDLSIIGSWTSLFQSTHLGGVRQMYNHSKMLEHINFNPRTLVGCDWKPILWSCCYWYFNPRTLVRCDDIIREEMIIRLDISIHAPWWGATAKIYKKIIFALR